MTVHQSIPRDPWRCPAPQASVLRAPSVPAPVVRPSDPRIQEARVAGWMVLGLVLVAAGLGAWFAVGVWLLTRVG